MKKQATEAPHLPKAVLIVEDSATQAVVLKTALEMHGWRVRVAGDGAAAMEQIRLSKPDIVVSDIRMPTMDGYALSKAIKTDPDLRDVPVVLFTSLSQPHDIIDAINSRADFYFLKQWDHDFLIAKIATVLDTYHPLSDPGLDGLTLRLDGAIYTIEANAQQPLTLLLSTYEIAVQQSLELAVARDKLRDANELLEEKVRARTAQLTASETRYRRLFESAKDGILILDAETGRIVDVNPFLTELLGFSHAQFLEKAVWDLGFLKAIIASRDIFLELQQKGYVRYEDLPLEKRDGTILAVEVVSNVYMAGDQKVIQCNIRDISERKQEAEEAARMVTVVRDSNDAITIQDFEGRITAWNHGAELMYGYSEAEAFQINIERLTAAGKVNEQRDFVRRLVAGEAVTSLETQRVTKDGRIIDVWMTVTKLVDKAGSPIGIASTERDITERKRAEAERQQIQAQLIQSQKLEAIGTLAGGVAHEINNPIMGIMNYAQLIFDNLGPDSLVSAYATEISKETERVATIVKNLLSFARQDKTEHSPARMCDIVDSTLSLIRAVMSRDQVTLEIDVPEDLPQIKCHSQQIRQVIMNLLTNARDALNERYLKHDANKKVLITARRIEKDGQPWIRTTVEDHGLGIPEDVRERIFEPFFTTKLGDKGTGLGLSISHGIVKDHGGELRVESTVGEFTRFHIDLPLMRTYTH